MLQPKPLKPKVYIAAPNKWVTGTIAQSAPISLKMPDFTNQFLDSWEVCISKDKVVPRLDYITNGKKYVLERVRGTLYWRLKIHRTIPYGWSTSYEGPIRNLNHFELILSSVGFPVELIPDEK